MTALEWEGPSLVVHEERNRLRKLPFKNVAELPPVTTAVRSFRGKRICVAIARSPVGDAVAVLVKGKVYDGKVTQEASFMKLPSGEWRNVPAETLEHLRTVISDAVPDWR